MADYKPSAQRQLLPTTRKLAKNARSYHLLPLAFAELLVVRHLHFDFLTIPLWAYLGKVNAQSPNRR
jgi:hypothetical protein